jgi:hypothetical protein
MKTIHKYLSYLSKIPLVIALILTLIIGLPVFSPFINNRLLPRPVPKKEIVEISTYIETFSGKITLDKSSEIWKIQFHNKKFDDKKIEYLFLHYPQYFRNTYYVGFEESSITNKSLVIIPKMFPCLFNLNLNKTGITNEGLQYLEECKQLSVLSISNTSIDDISIGFLLHVPNLRQIHIVNSSLTEDGINRLENAGIHVYKSDGR